MGNNIAGSVMNEYEAKKLYLATAAISVAELLDKAVQLLVFATENHIVEEETE
ncbi:MAG: hypothetical protein K6E85_01905 [Lachnospiraceae bacterium]|nr:hypothetical protein [Lachnospiraceae bacterium]